MKFPFHITSIQSIHLQWNVLGNWIILFDVQNVQFPLLILRKANIEMSGIFPPIPPGWSGWKKPETEVTDTMEQLRSLSTIISCIIMLYNSTQPVIKENFAPDPLWPTCGVWWCRDSVWEFKSIYENQAQLAQTCPTINYSDSEDWQLWSSSECSLYQIFKLQQFSTSKWRNTLPVKMSLPCIFIKRLKQFWKTNIMVSIRNSPLSRTNDRNFHMYFIAKLFPNYSLRENKSDIKCRRQY